MNYIDKICEQVQLDIENKLSRRNINHLIKQSIDRNHVVYELLILAIQEYISLAHTYTEEKQNRVLLLAAKTTEDIVEDLLVVTLQLKGTQPIQSSVGKLASKFKNMTMLQSIVTASEILGVCKNTGAYSLIVSEENVGIVLISSCFRLSPEVQNKINNTQYLPPMLSQPKDWDCNTGGGYLRENNSIILGKGNHHEGEQNIDAINILQSIEWQFTPIIKLEELPSKELDTEDKEIQFNLMKRTSRDVYNWLQKAGNRFYFVWKYDKRGRMYNHGYHVTLQGSEYKKASISFANKELVV